MPNLPNGKKRILLVEDEHQVRVLMQHVLLSAGYMVDVAETVAAALALLDSRRYDLVLTDDRLPDGRGIQVADAAHENGMDAVVVTGYALQSARRDRARYEHLLKPLRPSELIEAVERHLGGGNPPPGDIA